MRKRTTYKVLITVGIVCLLTSGILELAIRSRKVPIESVKEENMQKNSEVADTPEIDPGRLPEKIDIPNINSPRSTEEAEDEAENESILSGKIICIDPGHQEKENSEQEPIGPGSQETKIKVSSGAKGVATGKNEYDLNLEVALKLKEALIAKGANVCMTRETNDVDMSSKERAEYANNAHADLCIHIHAAESSNSSTKGFSILVPNGTLIDRDIIDESCEVAQKIESALTNTLPSKSRGIISKSDLVDFNWSEVPVILIEMGFMSHPEEDRLMSTQAFQDAFVNAVIEGLETYYKN